MVTYQDLRFYFARFPDLIIILPSSPAHLLHPSVTISPFLLSIINSQLSKNRRRRYVFTLWSLYSILTNNLRPTTNGRQIIQVLCVSCLDPIAILFYCLMVWCAGKGDDELGDEVWCSMFLAPDSERSGLQTIDWWHKWWERMGTTPREECCLCIGLPYPLLFLCYPTPAV